MSEQNRQEYSRRSRQSGRRRKQNRRGGAIVLLAAILICAGILVISTLGSGGNTPAATGSAGPGASPAASGQLTPSPLPEDTAAPEPTPTVTPTPTPTPTPAPTQAAYDYTAPAPASDPVEMDYFADAVFIGDSRTDGLQLYSGISGTTFLCYKGITVYDVMNQDKKVITIGGQKYSVLDALAMGQYRKVYISLGINELGYYNSAGFAEKYGSFIDEVRRIQPGAIIYAQSLVPVNPDKCKASGQPDWLNNEGIAGYNAALQQMCQEKQVVYLNISEALVDANGTLPAEATVDGLHFTRDWYKKWLDYLMNHTVAQS